MAKVCSNCGKKLLPASYYITITIQDSEKYIMCSKCGDKIDKIRKAINNSKTYAGFIENKENVLAILDNGDYSQSTKDFVEKEIFPPVEKRVKLDDEKRNAEIALQKAKEEVERDFEERVRNFKVTSGYNFEDYHIKNYIGMVSGEVVIGTGFLSEFFAGASDLFGTTSNAFSDKMGLVKEKALEILIKRAMIKGANAVIGVDFDYLTFSNNMIGISVNGTAVFIEVEDQLPEL